MKTHDFLVELGCEELPPKALKTLRDAFRDNLLAYLDAAFLPFDKEGVHAYATPRRLAVCISGVAEQQAGMAETVWGPPIAAAFDNQGLPTRAAAGFAKKAGLPLEQIDRRPDEKGVEKLCFDKAASDAPATAILPRAVEHALTGLPIARRMRWGASRVEFVRPVQWLVMLYGEHVVDCEILGQQAGRESRGHRFHHPGPVWLPSADKADYVQALGNAHVVAGFEARRERIRSRVTELATQAGGQAILPEALLDEVSALVEWPVPLVCAFEERFLAVPQEALIATMQDNQKYFCLQDASGKLMNRFVAVANIDSSDPAVVIAGNEKVVRPRLSDAEFFYHTDLKTPLAGHNEHNRQIVFQTELGSVYEKTQRMEQLAAFIARQIGGNEAWAQRTALLSRADLCTQMVGEFPELQGIMGEYYARHDGEADEVAAALREQYLPRFAGDLLPTSKTGMAVALADRLDTLAGLFAIGQPPTGSRDPFALRRAALGVLRILIEHRLPLPLDRLVDTALAGHGQAQATAVHQALLDFLLGRYRAMYEEQGIAPEAILAVLALRPMVPADVDARVRAVAAFQALPEAAALAAANKRVANILARESALDVLFNADLLQDTAEQRLHTALEAVATRVGPLCDAHHHAEALQALAGLREPVDAFFAEVMVLTDDPVLRNNRLALLARLRGLFLRIADISLLVPEKS